MNTIHHSIKSPTIFVSLLSAMSLLPCSKATILLAKSNACFSSTNYSASDRFNPPVNGEIYGIKLIHQSGSVNCYTNSATKWGCDAYNGEWLNTQMIEDDVTTYYPTNNTQGITDFITYIEQI